MASAPHAQQLAEGIKQNGLVTQVLQAQDALEVIASHPDVDAVMAAIVGAAGLAPCLAAAKAGKRLMLANKEALVVGGALFMDTVKRHGATLLPITASIRPSSSACLKTLSWADRVDSLLLTTWPVVRSASAIQQRCLRLRPSRPVLTPIFPWVARSRWTLPP